MNNKTETLYYIQKGYIGNAVCWWAKDSKGYTSDLDKAGKYTEKEMLAITKRPQDIGWRCDYIDNNIDAKKTIIDAQYLNKNFAYEDNLK